jgi:hypothetical protein
MKRTSTDSMHLPIDDAQHQLQVLGDPHFPAFITSQSRYQPVPAGLGDKDGGSGGVLLGIGPVRVLEDHQYRAEPVKVSIWETSASRVLCRRSSGAESSVG